MKKGNNKSIIALLGISALWFFTSAWPFLAILFVIYWLYLLVYGDGPARGFQLFVAVFICTLSIGEITFRMIGKNQTYAERNKNPLSHIIWTTYYSPFESDEEGWLHISVPHWPWAYFESRTTGKNREGLYDIERPLTKTKKLRVLALGDSFTQGVGSSNDSNFVKLLEKSIDTIEVLNAGISGSDPAFELKLLELKLFKYNPDMVIMSINSSDIYDFIARGGMARFLPDSTTRFKDRPWWEPLYGISFTVRAWINGVCRMDMDFQTMDEEKKAHQLALAQITHVIEMTSMECRQKNIRFIANFHPMDYEVINDSMHCDPIMKAVRSHGVETFDMLTYYITHGIDSENVAQYYWKEDRHHNNKGYAVMAKGLATLFN